MIPTTAQGYPAQVAVIRFRDCVNAPDGTSEPDLYRVGDDLIYRDVDGVEHIIGSAAAITGILGLDHGGTAADLSATTVNSTLARLTNKVASSASAVAFAIDNIIDLVTAGARLFSFRSAGVEKAAILGAGGLLAPTVGPNATQQHALPAATSDTVALVSAAQNFALKSVTGAPPTPPAASVGLGCAINGTDQLLTLKGVAGDQRHIGSIAGSGTMQVYDFVTCFDVANNATKNIDLGAVGGTCSLADNAGVVSATFGISTAGAANTGGLTFTNFSTTLTTANKLNVAAGSGTNVSFENKTGGTLHIAARFTLFRNP